jgi:hypothetical protein
MLAIGKFEKSQKIKIRNFLRNVFGKKDATKFEPTYEIQNGCLIFRKEIG